MFENDKLIALIPTYHSSSSVFMTNNIPNSAKKHHKVLDQKVTKQPFFLVSSFHHLLQMG